jgi:membrane protease YdiL (CAAX protease family)
MVLAMVAAVCVVLALGTVAFTPARGSSGGTGLIPYAVVMLLTGLAVAALITETARSTLARFLPIDSRSAVHATALVLTTVLVGSQLANQLAVDVLSQQASTGQALSPLDLVLQELPFLVAAALGVGLFIRRRPAATMDRLGLIRPTAWQVVLGLSAAFVFFAFGNGMDALAHVVSPGTAQKVDAANQHLFGQLGNPVGIATIALSAGICEEALFRGALQPRLGILWTAIVFTTVHTQYGLSLDAVAVLVLAIGLGLLRRVTNTTTSTVCHVVYNTLVGVGVSGVLLGPALIAGGILVVTSVAAFFTGRLGSLRTAP